MSRVVEGFLHPWRSRRRDSTDWLGWQDSNLGMAEPRSAQCDPQVCRTGSIPPKMFKAIRRELCVSDGRGNRAMAEVVLDGTSVVAVVCELVARRMAKHV